MALRNSTALLFFFAVAFVAAVLVSYYTAHDIAIEFWPGFLSSDDGKEFVRAISDPDVAYLGRAVFLSVFLTFFVIELLLFSLTAQAIILYLLLSQRQAE